MTVSKIRYSVLTLSVVATCYCAFLLYNGGGAWPEQRADWLGLLGGMLLTFSMLGAIRHDQMEAFENNHESSADDQR